MTEFRSWFQQNQTMVLFLLAQAVALATGGAALLAYMVKLETRVMIMETRGAEYTVERMQKMFDRLTVMENKMEDHQARLNRMTDQLLKDMQRAPQPR